MYSIRIHVTLCEAHRCTTPLTQSSCFTDTNHIVEDASNFRSLIELMASNRLTITKDENGIYLWQMMYTSHATFCKYVSDNYTNLAIIDAEIQSD